RCCRVRRGSCDLRSFFQDASKQQHVFAADQHLPFDQRRLQFKAESLKTLVGGGGLGRGHLEHFVPVRFPSFERPPGAPGTDAQAPRRPGDVPEVLNKHMSSSPTTSCSEATGWTVPSA